MTLIETLAFARSLYAKYQTASRLVQEELKRCFREVLRTGAIPLGYRKDEGGHHVAWWLIYDERKFASASQQLDALREMSPPGIGLKIIHF